MSPSLLRGLLVLTALLGARAGADRTVAPTPLYARPDLRDQPVLTLPSGKPVTVLRSPADRLPAGERPVLTVPYGERILYTRAGSIRESSSGVQLTGGQWGLPPQPTGPVTVFLERGDNTAARRVTGWEVRVLPLALASPGGVSLERRGAARSVPVRAQGAREAAALGSLAPGHYLVTAARADAPASVLSAGVLEVSDLALTALATPTGVLVWATGSRDGEVRRGVRLEAEALRVDQNGRPGPPRRLPSVTTDARGLALLPHRDAERLRLLGTVTLGGVTHRTVFNPWGYGLGSREPVRARALIQTDKPVYRPGETLRGLALVRTLEPGRRVPHVGPVTVRLVSGSYPPLTLARQQARTDADGLVRFEFPLPGDVRVGEYAVEVEVPGPLGAAGPAPVSSVSRIPVRVQAFVKPQFTLEVVAPTEIVTGDALPLRARAELYAGGGANVGAEVYLDRGSDQEVLFPPQGSASLYERYGQQNEAWEYWASRPFLSPEQKPTARLSVVGGQGQLTLRPTAPRPVPRTYSVVVRARDEYGRDLLEARTVTVHPAGLKFALPAFATTYSPLKPGEQVRSRVLVQRVGTGAAQPGRRVEVTVVRSFNEAVKVGGRTEYRNRQEVVSRREARSDAGGGVDVGFRVKGPGDYQVRLLARDASGHSVRGVYGAASVPEPAQVAPRQTLSLTADRERYAVGDSARLTLETDLPRGTPVLLSAQVEGRVMPRVVRVTGPRMTLTWPVTADLSPGLTFGAVSVYGADTLRAGTPLLFVPRTDRQLQVEVSAPRAPLKPGAETTLTVRTRQGGRPVSALVTLAVVHEAVYAVAGDPTPDPWRLLWGAEYPAVQLHYTAGAPAEGGGGGGGSQGGAAFRQDGREVAAFETVRTGPDGRAQVRVRLPELLGPYRIRARALTRGSAAGEARGEVRAELPFAVRLSRPRVLTHGDEGSAYLSVQDRSGAGGEVTLGLNTGGGETTRALPLNAGAATARFPLLAPASGSSLTLEAWARRAGLRDALRETLPLREAGPRTLLTGQGARAGAGRLSDPLAWPADARPESLSVDLAATPLQAALSSLDAYLADPGERWSTSEGTAARLSANLDLAGLAARLGWTALGDRARTQARRDLADLLALHGGGGWGWTGTSRPTAEMTAHALSALVQAKGAGLTDAVTLARTVQEARRLVRPSAEPGQVQLAVALARAGDPAAALRLARVRQVRAADDQARLAAALAGTAPDLARALYARARAEAVETSAGTLILGGSEDAEPTALLLTAALRLDRRADVAGLQGALLAGKTGSAWNSPVATATALSALRGLVEAEAGRDVTQATLTVGSFRQTVRIGAPVRVVVPPATLIPGQTLTLEADGPLAFVRELRVRRAGTVPAAPSPVVIERRYDRSRAARDGVVTVTLILRATSAQRHLRVTDPLPGGLEAVDDRPFAFPGWVQPAGAPRTVWADRSLYDDRVVFYLESVPAGVTTLRYQLRALAPGRYTAPAPRVDFSGGGAPAVGSAQPFEVTEGQAP